MTITEASLGATAQVYWEHRVIEAVDAAARTLDDGSTASEEARQEYAIILDFFEVYVDAWHFGNEERFLVPVLRAMGTAAASLAMQSIAGEHDGAREAFRRLKDHHERLIAGDATVEASFPAMFKAYLDLTMDHLHREDGYLYALLQNALSSGAQRQLGWELRHRPVEAGRLEMPVVEEEAARRLCTRRGVPFPTWDEVVARLESGERPVPRPDPD